MITTTQDIYTSPIGDVLFLAKIDAKYASVAYRLGKKLSEAYNHLMISPPTADGHVWLWAHHEEDTWPKARWLKQLRKSGLL
jgi:hypothetical protein